MICISRVHEGYSPRSMASCRSLVAWSGSFDLMASASCLVRFLIPWSVLKWYCTQNCSPFSLYHL